MSAEDLLSSLLLRWQEQMSQGNDLSAAELCRDAPELEQELREQIRILRFMNALVGPPEVSPTQNGEPLQPAMAAPCTPGGQSGLLQKTGPYVPAEPQKTVASGPPREEAATITEQALRQARQVSGYEIVRELGRGGMGVVYLARQTRLNRLVALKMILAGGLAPRDQPGRFRTEAEAVARLQHPNIVQVFEIGEHDSKPFFSLEFCAGGSLDRKLNGTPLPPLQAAQLVETLARAMHAAHQAQVIHRDLKPANVLLLADGTPKITDFGLARKMDEARQTQSGAVMGTPSYMAPEQAGGKTRELGPATDIYALGAILYELLTGRPPFKAATIMDTLHQVLTEEPVPPRQLQSQTPRDLETICLKCLHKEPGKRYPTAEELAEDLRRFQAGEVIAARPAGRLERGWRWCQRNPTLAGALAAVLLTFAAATTVSTVLAMLANQARGQIEKETADARRQRSAADADRDELKTVNTDLIQSRDALQKSNDRLLTTLARGLVRSLELQDQPQELPSPLSDREIAALWKLACPAEEELPVRFVEEALHGPVSTKQLKGRAPYALQAAVGLDAARRRQVEQVLWEKLQGNEMDPEQQCDLALILAHLGGLDPNRAGKVALVLTQKLRRATDPQATRELTKGLATVVTRMEPEEAAVVCGQAATILSQSLSKTANTNYAWFWEKNGPQDLQVLAEGLAAVSVRLEPKEAANVCGQAATLISQTMRKKSFTANQIWPLAKGLAAMTARMEPGEATAICAQAATTISGTQRISKKPDPRWYWEEDWVGKSLAVVANRMEPKEAAAIGSQVAATLSQTMSQTPDPRAFNSLVQTLAAVAASMNPKEADAVCGQAAARISQTMNQATDAGHLRSLAVGLLAVANGMEPKEAAAVCRQAAANLSQSMSKIGNPGQLQDLKEGLSAIAAGRDPKEAAEATVNLGRSMTKTADRGALGFLAQSLAVAGRMEPREAAAIFAQTMSQTKDPQAWRELSQQLSALLSYQARITFRDRCLAVASTVAGLSGPGPVYLAVAWQQPAFEPLSSPLPPPMLVELLKHPFCVGSSRRLVLEQLSRHYGRPFIDQWDFVRFAQEHKFGLDFTQPPQLREKP